MANHDNALFAQRPACIADDEGNDLFAPSPVIAPKQAQPKQEAKRVLAVGKSTPSGIEIKTGIK